MKKNDTLFLRISSYNSYSVRVWRILPCTQTIQLLWKDAFSTTLKLPWKLLKSGWISRTGVLPNLIQEIIPFFDVHWPLRNSTGHYPLILHAETAPCVIMDWLPGTQPHTITFPVYTNGDNMYGNWVYKFQGRIPSSNCSNVTYSLLTLRLGGCLEKWEILEREKS